MIAAALAVGASAAFLGYTHKVSSNGIGPIACLPLILSAAWYWLAWLPFSRDRRLALLARRL
jgi:hypothetical protein